MPLRVEITEKSDYFVYRAEVPGFTEKDLEVSVEPRKILIRGSKKDLMGKKKTATKRNKSAEKYPMQIVRWLELPGEVVPEKTKATLKKGVLGIVLRKAQPARKIEVKAA